MFESFGVDRGHKKKILLFASFIIIFIARIHFYEEQNRGMPLNEPNNPYPECKGLVRPKPYIGKVFTDANETFDLLPLYEKIQSDSRNKKHHSLQANEFLKCHWQSYKDHFNERVFKPFEFPEVGDYRFYIYHTRLLPQESIKNLIDYRKKLRVGPGVDLKGQIPIPNELHLKKGSSNGETKAKIKVGEKKK